jgi:NADH-quinone oxidoreductase subunit J
MQFLHYFLTILIVLSATAIFLSNNPVYSVLFLILNFCIASIILFMFEIEFLGLLFIMVYVGAVAVLFLFVVMMINTKKIIEKKKSTELIFLLSLSLSLLFIKLHFAFNDTFFNSSDDEAINSIFDKILIKSDNLSNVEIIGQALYNNYNIAVLLAGFVLLIALIGCVCLTVDYKEKKKIDKSYKQLSKNFNTLHKFK